MNIPNIMALVTVEPMVVSVLISPLKIGCELWIVKRVPLRGSWQP